MADWTQSMSQSFEYYVVDPGTWEDARRLTNVTGCTINRDTSNETLGSATIDITETLDECYVRIYLIVVQNGLRERFPLGTFLVQTPSTSFNGKVETASLDAYTPLLELKEKQPPLGYSLLKDSNIMDQAYLICRTNARAPVIGTESDATLYSNFVSNLNDTWTTFVSDLIANAKYELDLDERGRILFAPEQDTASLQPVWTYTDDNCSILYPDLSIERDLYGVPNVVEVIYSDATQVIEVRAVNDDPNSPISTVNRGREIPYRETSPSILGTPTEKILQDYANRLLKEMSSLEYTVSYSHGYNGVRLRDCIRFNHKRANLMGVKAKVISQSIRCETSCSVEETAVFTIKLWG